MKLTDCTKNVFVVKMALLRFRHFALPVVLCISSAAAAQENDCDPGVYVGKIGNVPVTISLDSVPEKTSEKGRSGTLYYRTSMVDMVLKQASVQKVWTEFDDNNKPSGRVTLACQDKQLTGEWLSLDGRKRFPVAAELSPDTSYNAQRFPAPKPIKPPTEAKDRNGAYFVTGPKMQGSEEADITGIQLFGIEPGVIKVNRLLWADLLANAETLMGCASSFRQRFVEAPPALSFAQSLSHTAGPYIAVESRIGFECGDGMRYGVEMATYRLTDGRKVDSSQWFKPELSTNRDQEWSTKPLAKLIARAGRAQLHKNEAECFKAAEYRVSDVYPSRDSLVFRGSLPTPFQFCAGAVDVTLPFAHLTPFLSAEGKRAVQAIQKTQKH